LNNTPVLLQDILDPDLEVESINIKIVWQQRSTGSPIKLKLVLADTQCHPGDAAVNAETGFYIVTPTESVIFLPDEGGLDGGGSDSLYAVIYDIVSAGSDEILEYTVELVVLCGITQSSKHSGALYEWASEVVAHACHDRWNLWVCSACIYFYIPYPLL
jgi:hypothetical protein